MADIPGFLHVFAAFHRPLDMVDQRTPSSMTLTWDVTRMKSWAVFFKHLNVVKPIWRISTWDIFKDMFGISMGYLWDIYVGDV